MPATRDDFLRAIWHNTFEGNVFPAVQVQYGSATYRFENILTFKTWRNAVMRDQLEGVLGFSVKGLNAVDQDLFRDVIGLPWSAMNQDTVDRVGLKGMVQVNGPLFSANIYVLQLVVAKINQQHKLSLKHSDIACYSSVRHYLRSHKFDDLLCEWKVRLAPPPREPSSTMSEMAQAAASAAASAARDVASSGGIAVAVVVPPTTKPATQSVPVGVSVSSSPALVAKPAPSASASTPNERGAGATGGASRPPYRSPQVQELSDSSDEDEASAKPGRPIARVQDKDKAPPQEPPPPPAQRTARGSAEKRKEKTTAAPGGAKKQKKAAASSKYPLPNSEKSVDICKFIDYTPSKDSCEVFKDKFGELGKWGAANTSGSRNLQYANMGGFLFVSIRRLIDGTPDRYMQIVEGSDADRWATAHGVKFGKKAIRSKGDIDKWWLNVVSKVQLE
jgi:hypothetical protein